MRAIILVRVEGLKPNPLRMNSAIKGMPDVQYACFKADMDKEYKR